VGLTTIEQIMAAAGGEILRIITKHEKEAAYRESDEEAGSCDNGRVYLYMAHFAEIGHFLPDGSTQCAPSRFHRLLYSLYTLFIS
jgi:hypothetical protein